MKDGKIQQVFFEGIAKTLNLGYNMVRSRCGTCGNPRAKRDKRKSRIKSNPNGEIRIRSSIKENGKIRRISWDWSHLFQRILEL